MNEFPQSNRIYYGDRFFEVYSPLSYRKSTSTAGTHNFTGNRYNSLSNLELNICYNVLLGGFETQSREFPINTVLLQT